jgi:hypothetical protein
MSILDDAIREHLELKRAHGADEAEVKKLEDEAFGPPGRPEEPDPLAEAPTEFMATPEAAEATEPAEESGRRINIADLQEPPPEPPEDEPPEPDERQAIADQPTEFFDVEAEMGAEDAPATEAPSPSDEEIVEAEAAEPKLAPVEPATEIYAARTEPPAEELADEEDEDEEFWSDQRLSDELDQALEAPLPLAEKEEDEPIEEEEEDEPVAEEPVSEEHDPPESQTDYDPDTGHEDVLEDTPDFLEDAPEDDELWFEQRPPKDFDLD